jgi:2,4-dienoyl-CoA reductase-like NADH-dependent reductase (Old Yellow Enzyme family)
VTIAMALLFSPISLRGLTAKNRIVVSPMCQYRSVDGGPVDWHLVHLGRFAIGGAGIVFAEETAIEPRGRKTYDCAGIYSDRHVTQYRRITDFLKGLGTLPAIQLGHAGAKGSCHGALRGWEPLTAANSTPDRPPWPCIAPSPIAAEPPTLTVTGIADRPRYPVPEALTSSGIAGVLAQWREAAQRSLDAGFEICEIHGAHGFLIHQFLSPITNRRTDAYGGDLAGRMRFALEVVETVRAVWPSDKPLFFRASSIDGPGGEWSMESTIELAKAVKSRGVDVFDCSSGGITGASALAPIPRVPGYHISYCARVRAEAGIMTMGHGMIARAEHAEDILRADEADLIGIAREALVDPNWPARAGQELGVPEYFDVLTADQAHRLRGRERERAAFPAGSRVAIPHSATEVAEYDWEARRASASLMPAGERR